MELDFAMFLFGFLVLKRNYQSLCASAILLIESLFCQEVRIWRRGSRAVSVYCLKGESKQIQAQSFPKLFWVAYINIENKMRVGW